MCVPNVDDILAVRLRRQLLDGQSAAAGRPASVVRHFCALQAQDYPGALWSVGMRCGGVTTAADVERAIATRLIVRTWPLRGTLHLIAPEDVRWILGLLGPQVVARAATRHAQLGLTEPDIARARSVVAEALRGGRILTRAELMAALESASISTGGQRGYHIAWTLALEGILCCGPMAGKKQTFVLLDDWIPHNDQPPLARPVALGRLAARYFEAHGPATLADFAWWSGLTRTDARRGISEAAGSLERLATGGVEYWVTKGTLESKDEVLGFAESSAQCPGGPIVNLLPAYDEYMLGYTDRSLQLGEHAGRPGKAVPANGRLSPLLAIEGRVSGTWKRTVKRDQVQVQVAPFATLTKAERTALEEEALRYGRFLGLPADVDAHSRGRP